MAACDEMVRQGVRPTTLTLHPDAIAKFDVVDGAVVAGAHVLAVEADAECPPDLCYLGGGRIT